MRTVTEFNPKSSALMRWASPSTQSQAFLSEYEDWIAAKLGVPRSEWVFINADWGADATSPKIFPLREALCAPTFEGSSVVYDTDISRRYHHKRQTSIANLAPKIEDIEIHEQSYYRFSVSAKYKNQKLQGTGWQVADGDMLVSFRLKDSHAPGVYLTFDMLDSPHCDGQRMVSDLIIAKRDLDAFDKLFLATAIRPDNQSDLITYSGPNMTRNEIVQPIRFQDLILDERVVKLVWNDLVSFTKRRSWFLKNHLPYKRGYLFYGPPGNGKTSLVRALLTKLKMDAYCLALSKDKVDDDVMAEMFHQATDNRMSLVLFEDLDRYFPKTGQKQTNVSLQALLNTLDGVSTSTGLITIATANEPTALDKAILKRPGRFDRVVMFGNPNAGLRERYFGLKAPHLRGTLTTAVDMSEGFSFAQLQETYIMAGQIAYERGRRKVILDDLLQGADSLRASTNQVGKSAVQSGFAHS